ncbi:MAG: chorismate synthase [Anaeroplasmataceae bacterium]
MNNFGKIFNISIYGESHGSSVGVIINGVPPGIHISLEDFTNDLNQRKAGLLGTTTRVEDDIPIIESGVFNNYTTGSPLMIKFLNSNISSKDYSNIKNIPRPGHADYTSYIKYNGFSDYRGSGHFSGRLTVALVAAGVVAKKITNFNYSSKIINLNGSTDENKYESIIKESIKEKDSIGGIVQIEVDNVKTGLGEPFFYSVESAISSILFSIGGVKGVEFGTGFNGVNLKGSLFNDSIIDESGKTNTNNSGGINGGITNSNPLIIKAFVKPTSSIMLEQNTYDFKNKKMTNLKIEGRHDTAIVLRARICLEAATAIALADLYLLDKTRR